MTTFVGTPEIIVASVCAVIGFLLVRECWRYWQENRRPPEPAPYCSTCKDSGYSDDYGVGPDMVCPCRLSRPRPQAEDMPHWWDKAFTPARVPMRNRFQAEDNDPDRSEALADQIVADQHLALETHGVRTRRPGPGDKGYRDSDYDLVSRAGTFTVRLHKGGGEALVTEDRGGVLQDYAMPSEWAEVLSAYALDLELVRHEKAAVRRAVRKRYGPEDLYWIDEMAKNDQR